MDHQSRIAEPVVTSRAGRSALGASGFTLVEMLTVIALILILMALAIPAINTVKNGSEFNQAAYNIGGYLDQARAYAMANNTYVFVGIQEVDRSIDESTQKNPIAPPGYGRLVFFAAGSKDGTAGYDPSSAQGIAIWKTGSNPYTKNLTALGKPLFMDNIHMAATLGAGTGRMARVSVPFADLLGNSASNSAITFSYPVGAAYPNGQYNFMKVIVFGPQGTARIQTNTNGSSLPSAGFMEIGLQPIHGNNGNQAVGTPTPGTNQAALVFDCMSGTYRVYRP